MMNRVVLVGRLTADPELRYTQGGVAVANFTLAVDRPFRSQSGDRETDFIKVVVWRKQAENCGNYLNKGAMAGIDGRLQIRSYEDRDGQRRWVAEVVGDNVQFLSQRGTGSVKPPKSDGDDIDLDDLPF